VTAAGLFFTHVRSPRVRRHFQRLVAESGSLVEWHFVFNPDSGARPKAPFAYEDPATVMAGRYRAMERNGGVQGGYLDTALIPCLRALRADHLWVMEYDVDFAGRWADLFAPYAESDADLLTATLMYRSEAPDWPHWARATAPPWVPPDRMIRALHPLMRVSRELVNWYAVAMVDDAWGGHYEFTLPTSALVAGARIEDLGGDGAFSPASRRGRVYVGRTPAGVPEGMTFGFRPVRSRYFHESPESFERPGMLYHPVKPAVRVWTEANKNLPTPPRD
jgi:hypothetical protein